MDYPAVLPHDHPKQIADDLFVVHGCIKINPMVRFTRNMAIVREGQELTLINPVRMNEAGLAKLEALGDVKHVLRLGCFHGRDDPFYVDRYKSEFWSFEGGTTYTEPDITKSLSEGGNLPFSNAKLFSFNYLRQPEGAILLERSPNILLSCDAIQSYATPPYTPHTNWFTRRLMPRIGFPRKTLIGPMWMDGLATDRNGMKGEFERLMEWQFDQLLSAHGTFLAKGAHQEVRQAFDKMFAEEN